ncbi:MAG: (Fe-S)-binding protein [Deltaproteobacteria bacterium]|nr:(Fe-S)-binding protein [Deltaproteobacteria bacterium]
MAFLVVKAVIIFALTAFWIGWSFIKFRRLHALINVGKDENLKNNISERITRVIQMVFFHKKVLEDPVAGIMHAFFIYGFLVLGAGHMELLLSGITAPLTPETQTGILYETLISKVGLPDVFTHLYHLTQDVMAMFMLVVGTFAIARRWSGKVERLMPRSMDAEIILYFIVVIYITFFFFVGAGEAFRMARGAQPVEWHWWQPLSSYVAMWMSTMSDDTIWTIHQVFYWAHTVLFLAFGSYIPISKHMHLVFAGPNIYFHRAHMFKGATAGDDIPFRKEELSPGKGLPPRLDFMDENLEKYGLTEVHEYSWKTLLDTFACTECGRCNDVCPAHLSGKPLQPKKVLHDIKENLREKNAEKLLSFRDANGNVLDDKKDDWAAYEPDVALINRDEIAKDRVRDDGKYLDVDGQIHLDEAWACTTCGACAAVCPVAIDSVPGSLLGLRQNMVMMEADFPQELNAAFKGLENQGNPWGAGADKREDWATGLDVPVMSKLEDDKKVDYLFWVGCAGATDDRAMKTQQALVKILKAADVSYAILGSEETCCGDPARRLGNEYVYDTLARGNVDILDSYKDRYDEVLTACPHCFNSLKNDYKDIDGEYKVTHHTELIQKLMADDRIPQDAKKSLDQKVTYHDPCYVGRYNQIYDEPREVLVQLKGTSVKEMDRNEDKSFCCGAGGGRMWMEEDIGDRVNVMRTEQAMDTGADTIAVGCPFCMTMITDGTKAKDVEESIQVMDVAELVAQRMPDEAKAE